MTVGERIHLKRHERGMTLEEIGNACCVSKTTVCRYETGEIEVRRTIAMKLAAVLGVTPAWLLGWQEGLPAAAQSVLPLARIPVLGVIRAGSPIMADEHVIGYEFSDRESADGRFYLQVQGDSMIGANIHDGCRILFNIHLVPADGDIVACLIGPSDATVKRYRERGNEILLCPENPAYQPIVLSKRDFEAGWARILGVAEEVVHRLR
ncbi:MAG: S24 family peptidase [Pygmaiobacter sp.]